MESFQESGENYFRAFSMLSGLIVLIEPLSGMWSGFLGGSSLRRAGMQRSDTIDRSVAAVPAALHCGRAAETLIIGFPIRKERMSAHGVRVRATRRRGTATAFRFSRAPCIP
jgi:hypothetical protein